jgi:hypothetical protein
MDGLEGTMNAFKLLFPKLRENEFLLRPRDLPDFPFWLKAAVDVFLLEIPHLYPPPY